MLLAILPLSSLPKRRHVAGTISALRNTMHPLHLAPLEAVAAHRHKVR
jgi:hypothetical protein